MTLENPEASSAAPLRPLRALFIFSGLSHTLHILNQSLFQLKKEKLNEQHTYQIESINSLQEVLTQLESMINEQTVRELLRLHQVNL